MSIRSKLNRDIKDKGTYQDPFGGGAQNPGDGEMDHTWEQESPRNICPDWLPGSPPGMYRCSSLDQFAAPNCLDHPTDGWCNGCPGTPYENSNANTIGTCCPWWIFGCGYDGDPPPPPINTDAHPCFNCHVHHGYSDQFSFTWELPRGWKHRDGTVRFNVYAKEIENVSDPCEPDNMDLIAHLVDETHVEDIIASFTEEGEHVDWFGVKCYRVTMLSSDTNWTESDYSIAGYTSQCDWATNPNCQSCCRPPQNCWHELEYDCLNNPRFPGIPGGIDSNCYPWSSGCVEDCVECDCTGENAGQDSDDCGVCDGICFEVTGTNENPPMSDLCYNCACPPGYDDCQKCGAGNVCHSGDMGGGSWPTPHLYCDCRDWNYDDDGPCFEGPHFDECGRCDGPDMYTCCDGHEQCGDCDYFVEADTWPDGNVGYDGFNGHCWDGVMNSDSCGVNRLPCNEAGLSDECNSPHSLEDPGMCYEYCCTANYCNSCYEWYCPGPLFDGPVYNTCTSDPEEGCRTMGCDGLCRHEKAVRDMCGTCGGSIWRDPSTGLVPGGYCDCLGNNYDCSFDVTNTDTWDISCGGTQGECECGDGTSSCACCSIIWGCTDPDACNYNEVATSNDDSCLFNDDCGVCGGPGLPPLGCWTGMDRFSCTGQVSDGFWTDKSMCDGLCHQPCIHECEMDDQGEGTTCGGSNVGICFPACTCGYDTYDCAGECFGNKVSCDQYEIVGYENGCALDGYPNCTYLSNCSVVDECGVCGGNNACLDCAGVPNGDAVIGCDGVCGSGLENDDCGTCDGPITDCDTQCPANYGPWPDGENHWNTETACNPVTFDCQGDGNNYCIGVCGHRDCVRDSSNCSTYIYAWQWRCFCDCDNSCNAAGCP